MADAAIDLKVGSSVWALHSGPGVRIAGIPALGMEPLADPGASTRKALDAPIDFPPIRRAVTPGDKVALVITDSLPQLDAILAAVISYLIEAQVEAADITVISPPNSPESWVENLPDELSDVQTARHDPSDSAKLAYIASTRGGRRVYLNRAVADADQVIILTRRGRTEAGPTGGVLDLFPALAEAPDARRHDGPAVDANEEAVEVAWMLGLPIFVQVIEGPNNSALEIMAGPSDSLAEGVGRFDAVWTAPIPNRAPAVVAAISGGPEQITLSTLVAALENAARVCERDGRILLLTEASPDDEGLFELGRSSSDAEGALAELRADPARAGSAAVRWLEYVSRYRVSLASGWSEADTESAFASKVEGVGPVQRLIDGDDCVVLPEAAKARLAPRNGTHAAGR